MGGAACQKKTVQPCQRYNQNAQARCNRRCANTRAKAQRQQEDVAPPPPTRIVVQRTPIHMDDSHSEFAKMSLDVTGFAPHQIKVSVDDYVVSISGERRNKLGDLFVIDRKFRLDKKTALVDGVEASFDDNDDVAGILEIVVPKNVSAGPRTIPIAVTSSKTTDDETNEETEVVKDNTMEDDNAQTDAAAPADHEDEEEQNHPAEEVTSVETVQEEDADEEVEDEQQTDATTEDSGGDAVVTEGLEWEEVASEEKE